MTIKLPARLLMAALVAASAAPAHAVRYLEASGANVQIFYDADFWGDGATVSGDKIVFAPGAKVFGSVTSVPGEDVSEQLAFSSVVVAVAHQGVALTGDISYGSQHTYSLAENGSYAEQQFQGWGGYANPDGKGGFKFDSPGALASVQYDTTMGSNGVAPRDFTTAALDYPGMNERPYEYERVGAELRQYFFMGQYGAGTSRVSLSMASFNFGTVATVSAVPEPETYAMLLAGLGLMGLLARRRKAAPGNAA